MTAEIFADRQPDILDLLVISQHMGKEVYEFLNQVAENRCPGGVMAVKERVAGKETIIGAAVALFVNGDAARLAAEGKLDDRIVPFWREGEKDLFIAALYLDHSFGPALRAVIEGIDALLGETERAAVKANGAGRIPRIISVAAATGNSPELKLLYREHFGMEPADGSGEFFATSYDLFDRIIRKQLLG